MYYRMNKELRNSRNSEYYETSLKNREKQQ